MDTNRITFLFTNSHILAILNLQRTYRNLPVHRTQRLPKSPTVLRPQTPHFRHLHHHPHYRKHCRNGSRHRRPVTTNHSEPTLYQLLFHRHIHTRIRPENLRTGFQKLHHQLLEPVITLNPFKLHNSNP